MKIALASEALFDTMPATTSFHTLTRLSLDAPAGFRPSVASPDGAGSAASSLLFAMLITPLPSRRT